jgi:hypothetical protein
VEERAANARELRRATGGHIVWDVSHDGHETLMTALRMAVSIPAIHLEDDIVLTSRWREKIEAVIAEHPDVVCQFFSRRKADLEVGSRWQPGRDWVNAQCFYMPARLSRGLVDFLPGWQAATDKPILFDLGIAAYLKERKERYWLSCPSLVDHRVWRSAANPGNQPDHRPARNFVP